MKQLARNITIGLIDGLTIPFALAAGLSAIVASSSTVFFSCLVIIIAYSITMFIGAYLSREKEQPGPAAGPAMIVGISYTVGGLISVVAFLSGPDPKERLPYAAVITLITLFIAGYFDSALNGSNGWVGAIRVAATGAIAAGAAYGVAGLFR